MRENLTVVGIPFCTLIIKKKKAYPTLLQPWKVLMVFMQQHHQLLTFALWLLVRWISFRYFSSSIFLYYQCHFQKVLSSLCISITLFLIDHCCVVLLSFFFHCCLLFFLLSWSNLARLITGLLLFSYIVYLWFSLIWIIISTNQNTLYKFVYYP